MNTEHKLHFSGLDVYYIHHPHHRNDNVHKSQWIISQAKERKCFEHILQLIYQYGWGKDSCCWGLYIVEGRAKYLGRSAKNSPAPERQLFIAKFVDSSSNDRWHGYPSDHVLNAEDIPTPELLQYWMERGYLSASKIRKVAGGKKCKL